MADTFGDCAFEMSENLEKQGMSGIVLNLEMMDLFSKYTNDVLIDSSVETIEIHSTLLSFASYELATNPEVQRKLYAEIFEANQQLQGNRLTRDVLKTMKYMDMVISEVLRMWPAAMFTDRLCTEDYEYNYGGRKFVIEKGTNFWNSIYAFHRDEKYFPNPSKFDPERFSDEQKDSNCIGSRFALLELKAVIYYLLLKFKFIPNAHTQIPLIMQQSPGGPAPEKGIHLRLMLRCFICERGLPQTT